MSQTQRLPEGGLVDRGRPLGFRFDGRDFEGYAGDTLASALLANGQRLLGRSFKYHRPRSVLTADSSEPNALISLRHGPRQEPNSRATTVELFDGLAATSQNRWPSLGFDVMAVNGLLSPLFVAGFYYKTFKHPKAFWTSVYEPLIRRAAGLGRGGAGRDPDSYETRHVHCDCLVVGGGPLGLAAARRAAEAGQDVILCDEGFAWGGCLLAEAASLDGRPGLEWISEQVAALAAAGGRLLLRTTVYGWYDGNVLGAVERVADHLAEPPSGIPRQRHWEIVTRKVILATGAEERPLVFAGNDCPGVMLASAARAYLNRWAVRPGKRAVLLGRQADLSHTGELLSRAGLELAAAIDIDGRPEIVAKGRATGLRALRHDGRWIEADLLCMAGGWSPRIHLLSQRGVKPVWDAHCKAFVAPGAKGEGFLLLGAPAGQRDLTECLDILHSLPAWTAVDPGRLPGKGKAFVDFQNDVTADDVALAAREGYAAPEHLKRYTTLGMATDQGKTSSVNGLALLSDSVGRPLEALGTTTFRPPVSPVALGTLAGPWREAEWRPVRRTPLHRWNRDHGALFLETGLWLRSQSFPREGENLAAATNREVLAVRRSVGLCDISTLGKIEVLGPDALAFLERVYANNLANLPIGRCRYAIMLREDGIVFDDGTVSRLGNQRYFLTTTSGAAAAVMAHLEYCHQVLWPNLDLAIVSTTEHWAGLAIAGPHSRRLLEKAFPQLDLSDDAFPFMSAREIPLGDSRLRLLRVSFSGELAFELYAPAHLAEELAESLLTIGTHLAPVLYGVEALGVMRIEKGHAAGSEINGATTAEQLNLGGLVSRRKAEFIGKALLARPGLSDPALRPQLVGLRALNPTQAIVAGAHLLPCKAVPSLENDLGYVTAATWSPTLESHIALALLIEGRNRHGEQLAAVSPLTDQRCEVMVCSNVFYDPAGERLRV